MTPSEVSSSAMRAARASSQAFWLSKLEMCFHFESGAVVSTFSATIGGSTSRKPPSSRPAGMSLERAAR